MIRLGANIFHHPAAGEVDQQRDNQPRAAQVIGYRVAKFFGDHRRQRQRQQRTDIYRHIEQGKCPVETGILRRIAFGEQARRVGFKQTVADGDGAESDKDQLRFQQRHPGHKVADSQHNGAEHQRAFGPQQMVAHVAANGDQPVNQRREGAEGDKGLFLREAQLFNKEDRQDPLNAVIAKTFPELHKEDHKERTRLLQQARRCSCIHIPSPCITFPKSMNAYARTRRKCLITRHAAVIGLWNRLLYRYFAE